MARVFRTVLTSIVLLPVRIYKKLISPFLAPACRYFPSCSSYMEEAVKNLGPAKGILIGLFRIGRCSGLFCGGLDRPPARLPWKFVPAYIVRRYRRFSQKHRNCAGS